MCSFSESFQYCLLLEHYNNSYINVVLLEEISTKV